MQLTILNYNEVDILSLNQHSKAALQVYLFCLNSVVADKY